ncbi:hypothetical protein AB0878_44895 [Amycolatopsis sp. NPDC047767]|uniref:ParB/RepB/Spo0J family partition protein n=1 Tax=Amycolatopsis sp. NPDC047767 TaxID=3156765 RepID=UPI0034545183
MTLTVGTTEPEYENALSAPEESDAAVPSQPAGPTEDEPGEADRLSWAEEIDTIVHADPHEVVILDNVRTVGLETDKRTVANYQQRGVNTATNGYRRDDGVIVVTEGQRRVLHAREAGTTVPVWMKQPPTEDEKAAEIKRVLDQLDENDQRQPLTHGDTANAHQYLLDLGVSAAKIARERGKARAEIKASLALAASQLAVKAADKYQLDTLQAAEIAWFEEQGLLDEAKRLIVTAVESPNNFKTLARRLRNDQAEAATIRELTEALTSELDAAGVTIVDGSVLRREGPGRSLSWLRPTPDDEPRTELTAEAHIECPGHVAWLVTERRQSVDRPQDQWDISVVPTFGCSDFLAHGHALKDAPRGKAVRASTAAGVSTNQGAVDEATRQANRIIRKWVISNNKDWDAATEVRREWLREFAGRRRAPEGAHGWLATQKAIADPTLYRPMEHGHRLARTLLGTDDLAGHAATLSGARATVFDVFLTLAAYEEHMSRTSWRTPVPIETAYMQTLASWGYKPSDVELKVITPEREDDVVSAAQPDALSSDGDDVPADSVGDEDVIDAETDPTEPEEVG